MPLYVKIFLFITYVILLYKCFYAIKHIYEIIYRHKEK